MADRRPRRTLRPLPGPAGGSGGSSLPASSEMLAAANPWCARPAEAGPAMAEALAQGGRQAQLVVAVASAVQCAYNVNLLQQLANAPSLLNPVTVVE